MKPHTDHGYDELTDRLAEDFASREFDRPSLYFTASAFVRAMRPTVAANSSAATRHEPGGADLLPASPAVAPDLRRSGGGHRPSA